MSPVTSNGLRDIPIVHDSPSQSTRDGFSIHVVFAGHVAKLLQLGWQHVVALHNGVSPEPIR